MTADLMAMAQGIADETVLRSHYANSLTSPQLAARLDAIIPR